MLSDKHAHGGEFSGPWWRFPPMRAALLSGAIVAAAWLGGHVFGLRRLEPWGYAFAALVGGRHFFREAATELWTERAVGIDLLMSAAAVGAAALGLWDEAAILVFLYAAAESLEEYAYARTRSAICALLDLAPKEARVLRDGRELTIPAADLCPGDLFLVRPGEAIATDGIIREGASTVDESAVTGESMPTEKEQGARVFAGTVNRHGALVIETTTAFEDNTLSRIVHMVEEAQEQKGRAQLFIERFGRRYSPTVLVGAALLLIVPPLFGQPLVPWAVRAVVLLVAAAPCALVMSTPVAAAAGIGIAGRQGVLIKGGVHLENLGRVRVVAFDKTGTLTEGTPEVTDIVPIGSTSPDQVLRFAASVERFSEHHLATAIVRRAQELGVKLMDALEFEALPGLGAQARVDGRQVLVGSAPLLESHDISTANATDVVARLQSEGKAVVAVGADQTLLGVIALRDRMRQEAKAAPTALRQMGIQTVMLTGDAVRTAAAVASEFGIDKFYAELKPEEKVDHIRRMEREVGVVAMVGDGINDAPALAAATVGIAMGAAGTDAAIEAADVALMTDDLRKVVYAIHLGRTARAISRQNIVFSILILSVLVPGALVGALTVVAAVLAHEVSELLAVANGLRVARQGR